MSKSLAEKILAECAVAFPANSLDCNKFVKAITAVFFEPDLFTGPGMNADAIIKELKADHRWNKIESVHADAIRHAKGGKLVLAGMSSTELSSDHGHLAVVVGDDGQHSGSVIVPICYAGSLNPAARVQRKRVSETFGAAHARESRINYFARIPQMLPVDRAIDRLVDFIRGVSRDPNLMDMKKLKKK